MKRVLSLIVVLGVVASLTWLGMERLDFYKKGASKTAASHANALAANRPVPLPMESYEWHKYEDVRKAALTANPALQSEYKDILQKMNVQQTEDFAAIVKTDPKVAPVIAKLEALRSLHTAPIDHSHASKPDKFASVPAAMQITPKEWQELDAARNLAIKANPDLMQSSEKLNDRLRSIEVALNAAMAKADSEMAPLITKFGASIARETSVNATVTK